MNMLDRRDLGILIVDDNDISRSMLRHILNSEAFNVIGEASSGVIALDWLEKTIPEIVCLDVMMPDISGLEILEHIKSVSPETVVLMVTGSNNRDTVVKAIKAGANGFIVKPFNPATLLQSMHYAVNKSQKQLKTMIDRRKAWKNSGLI
ncbi:MAG: response regulator [Undibacterium umbellatum]|jgi:two-component system chemotaxis response regulator CheY|uniref:Response regulator n=2 Tax=Undibacterium umbellatum TaxID=2762300 RepID=A0ABR6Z5H0_9BURK|nr:response regulator [Undibacterium sp.]MBC3907027.1 response regulator [Undibacterium umbellatum]MDP1977392.1 response regulator [Undibacterium sp.]